MGCSSRSKKLDVPFSYAWGPVGHLLSVKNSDDLREAHEAVLQDVVAYGLRVQQSRPIYEGLVAIRDGEEWAKLDEAQKRCIELKIRAAEHAGVGLEGTAKERFNEIAKELSQISTDFSNHVLDATKDYELIIENKKDTEGWPNSLQQVAAQSYAQANEDSEATPEMAPGASHWISELLSLYATPSHTRPPRTSVQSLCPTRILWRMGQQRLDRTHLKIAPRAIRTPGFCDVCRPESERQNGPRCGICRAHDRRIAGGFAAHSEQDFGALEALAKASGQEEPVMHWDTSFWSERLREQKFDYTDDQLRPYFPLPKVLDGLFALAERLFDIEIARADDENAHKWHEDVQFFKVLRDGERIASFYRTPILVQQKSAVARG